jgi:hypothetical protein
MFELVSRHYEIQLLLETEQVPLELRTRLREVLRELDQEIDEILKKDPKQQA